MKLTVAIAGLLTSASFLSACGEETSLVSCRKTAKEPGANVEAISTLEDAFALQSEHDAVLLDFAALKPEQTSRRVTQVEVLVMIPTIEFDQAVSDIDLSVEVFDAASPASTQPWVLRQRLDKSKLDWTHAHLNAPATAVHQEQMRAWWPFDFSELIPEEGMKSAKYVVGAAWHGARPTLGYSNYNLACDRNWTDYGTGWMLNSNVAGQPQNTCSWPMLRVEVETVEEVAAVSCD